MARWDSRDEYTKCFKMSGTGISKTMLQQESIQINAMDMQCFDSTIPLRLSSELCGETNQRTDALRWQLAAWLGC